MHRDKAIEAVSAAFDIPISEINGRSLNRRVCLARSMVYLVLRDRYAYTGGQIAKLLNRDTACVCRALQQIDHLIGRDKGVTAMFEDVIKRIDGDLIPIESLGFKLMPKNEVEASRCNAKEYLFR